MEVNDWVPVHEYEGLYEISESLGKVRSLNYNGTGRVKILKALNCRGGYVQVRLYKNKKWKCFILSRLVAEHFVPNPLNLPQVNHKNEDKTDNRACNLEWCSAKYNNNYGTRTKRAAKALRNHVKKSKPVLQYTLDGELVREWPSARECERNGFESKNISACCLGKRKSHKGFVWCFK